LKQFETDLQTNPVVVGVGASPTSTKPKRS